jgi:SPP1 gp7 family putative phage head morphogenesis protein
MMPRSQQRLLDVLTRHQIYLEGVKAFQLNAFNKVLIELNKELKYLFVDMKFDTFDQMTKAQLMLFLREVRATQNRVYSAYLVEIVEQLKAFMQADRKVSKSIFATLALEADASADEPPAPVNDEAHADHIAGRLALSAGLLGLAALKPGKDGAARMWASIVGAPIPANGLNVMPFLQGFVASASKSIENIVTKGYANKSTVKEVLAEIQGSTEANRRDGQLNRVFGQAGAVLDTVLQHVSSTVQAGIASQYYERYQWVSVLDRNTTDICRSRDGKKYRYGEGPLPPAHIRCRSKTVPVDDDPSDPPKSFYDFAKNQPIAVQNDILGAGKADALRSGDLKASDMPKFESDKPLSVEQFANKLNLMLKR